MVIIGKSSIQLLLCLVLSSFPAPWKHIVGASAQSSNKKVQLRRSDDNSSRQQRRRLSPKGKGKGNTDEPTSAPTQLECPGGVDPIIVEAPPPTPSPTKISGKGKGGKGKGVEECLFELACPPCERAEDNFDIALVADTNVFAGTTFGGGFGDCLVQNANNVALMNELVNFVPDACFELDDAVLFDTSRSAFSCCADFNFDGYATAIGNALTGGTTFSINSMNPLTIPEGTKSLVLVAPDSSYSEAERMAIFCFIQSGGRLTMITDGSGISASTITEFNSILGAFDTMASFDSVVNGGGGDPGSALINGELDVICTGAGTTVSNARSVALYADGETYIGTTNVGSGSGISCE